MSALAGRALHAVQINFFQDVAGRSPRQLLEAWPTLVDTAEAASCGGVRVSVVQACAQTALLERGGVRYYFLPFDEGSRTVPLAALGALLHGLAPDVLHVHGLHFPRELLALAALAQGIPIVAQDHASQPPRIWRRASWRRGYSVLAGICFCAAPQAQPFADAGLVAPHTHIYEIPESTTRFGPGDHAQARLETGVTGDPAILWVGHLDRNKDPLTVLDGVSAATQTLPGLRLWCCFAGDALLRPVQQRIGGDARLRDRVVLLGRVSHQRIEQLMRAADLFVLGSHHEGSGYSLIEALGCGLTPLVTDIPSFRALTAEGTVGRLWPCDDARALCDGLAALGAHIGPQQRAAVRAHFERELSFDALGAKLAAMYQDVSARRALRDPAERVSDQHRAFR
jgi:glycosyltransferase involved in cell wall biosynthesis